jgi:hypothetical protein
MVSPRLFSRVRVKCVGQNSAHAANLGRVEAPTIDEVAVAAQEYGVPASMIIVQAIGYADQRRPFRRGEIIGQVVEPEPASEAGCVIRCPDCGGWIDALSVSEKRIHEPYTPPQNHLVWFAAA